MRACTTSVVFKYAKKSVAQLIFMYKTFYLNINKI